MEREKSAGLPPAPREGDGTMIKKFKNLRPGLLITHLIITLAYPLIKAFSVPNNRLLVFTDAMTIVALILVVLGILYSLVLHGDFDISSYYFQRAAKYLSRRRFSGRDRSDPDPQKDLPEYLNDSEEKREESFNYPLFLGIVYLLAALVLAYGVLS